MGDRRHQSESLLSRKRLSPLLPAIGLALALLSFPSCGQGSSHPDAFSCPKGDPLRGVYDPSRLKVLATCRWYRGRVVDEGPRSDGDTHLLIKPDPGSAKFLDLGNVNEGGLIVEIMPGQQLPTPSIGEHVSVFGTWVFDTNNNWNEIHPVWGIRSLDTGAGAFALPPVPPEYQGSSSD